MNIMQEFELQARPTISEEIFQYLRKKILTGEIHNTQRLIEAKLAEAIKISRTPVREALKRLEMEKLIKSLPRGGYVVRDMREQEVDEICEIRAVLEALAAQWASARITARELERLDKIILLTDEHIEQNNTQAVVELDAEFHNIICKASRSQRVEEISKTLMDHMLRFRMKALCVAEIAYRSNNGHRRILQALKKGDNNSIQSAYKYHLGWTKKDVAEVLKKELKATATIESVG